MAVTDPETKPFDLAMIDPSIGEPPLNWPTAIDPDQIALAYDGALDTVFLDFFGRPLPAVNVPLDSGEVGYVDALVGIESNIVVGIEIAAYQSQAVVHHPRWRELADFVEIAPSGPTRGRNTRSTQSSDWGARRRSLLEAILADVSAMPVYDDSEERCRTP
jgi:hypothetical protein